MGCEKDVVCCSTLWSTLPLRKSEQKKKQKQFIQRTTRTESETEDFKGKNESQLSHGIGLRYGGHRGVNDTWHVQ